MRAGHARLLAFLLVASCAGDEFTSGGGSSDAGASDAAAGSDAGTGADSLSEGSTSEGGATTDAFCATKFPNAAFCMDFEDGLTTAHEGPLAVTIGAPLLDTTGSAVIAAPPDVASGRGALAVASTKSNNGVVHAEYFEPFTSPAGVVRAHARFDLRIDAYSPSTSDILSIARIYLRDGTEQTQAELDLMPNGSAALIYRSKSQPYVEHDVGLPLLGALVAVDLDLRLEQGDAGSVANAVLSFNGAAVTSVSFPQPVSAPVANFIVGLEAPHDAPTRLVLDNFVFETK